jgi:toxin HigB-1
MRHLRSDCIREDRQPQSIAGQLALNAYIPASQPELLTEPLWTSIHEPTPLPRGVRNVLEPGRVTNSGDQSQHTRVSHGAPALAQHLIRVVFRHVQESGHRPDAVQSTRHQRERAQVRLHHQPIEAGGCHGQHACGEVQADDSEPVPGEASTVNTRSAAQVRHEPSGRHFRQERAFKLGERTLVTRLIESVVPHVTGGDAVVRRAVQRGEITGAIKPATTACHPHILPDRPALERHVQGGWCTARKSLGWTSSHWWTKHNAWRYARGVIRSFRDPMTERLWSRQRAKGIDSRIERAALRKLVMLDAAEVLDDLRVPPGNRLEALKGDRAGQHSIRINQQWRICFVWTAAGPEDVQIVDYH